jgi:hypothetical protein
MIRLTGLWKNKSKDGKTYYSGQLNKHCKVLIFPNYNKDPNSNQPDFELCIREITYELEVGDQPNETCDE